MKTRIIVTGDDFPKAAIIPNILGFPVFVRINEMKIEIGEPLMVYIEAEAFVPWQVFSFASGPLWALYRLIEDEDMAFLLPYLVHQGVSHNIIWKDMGFADELHEIYELLIRGLDIVLDEVAKKVGETLGAKKTMVEYTLPVYELRMEPGFGRAIDDALRYLLVVPHTLDPVSPLTLRGREFTGDVYAVFLMHPSSAALLFSFIDASDFRGTIPDFSLVGRLTARLAAQLAPAMVKRETEKPRDIAVSCEARTMKGKKIVIMCRFRRALVVIEYDMEKGEATVNVRPATVFGHYNKEFIYDTIVALSNIIELAGKLGRTQTSKSEKKEKHLIPG